ncbi:EamA family transporter [Silanimonas lenta]|uniref:EamA family transporter n=1 Tax=Silanimonas lenta TaxID=265429 RepID=UPI002FE3ABA2
MSSKIVLALLGVVFLMALGQVMFKASAQVLNLSGTWLDYGFLLRFIPSLMIYGLATLAWVWVLRYVELSKAYPFMALAFILVPLASMWLFNERLNWRYAIGVTLIFLGVAIIGAGSSISVDAAVETREGA